MKAIDYVNNFEKYTTAGHDSKKAAGMLLMEYIQESTDMIKTRHVSTDIGLLSILRELDEKWSKMAAIINEKYLKDQSVQVNCYAFRLWVLKHTPEAYPLLWSK